MMFDTIERVGDSEIHHGTMNDRIYLSRLHEDDLDVIFNRVEWLAEQKRYGKIVSKVPRWALDTFLEKGHRVEAEIPGLYKGATNGYFVAGYPDKQRPMLPEKKIRFIESVKNIALATSDNSPKVSSEDYVVRSLEAGDMPALAQLNRRAFGSYPYPVSDPAYLCECLEGNFSFFGIFRDDKLLEAAIVYTNYEESHAEIIDFVIPSELRGQNLSYHLLGAIKKAISAQGVKTLYSSVRATSYGLNITFRKQGFNYGGTLVNNTRVGGCMESMNIWYA